MWRILFLLFLPFTVLAQKTVKLNQLGFAPEARKIAAVPSIGKTKFAIMDPRGKKELFTGTLNEARYWPYSEEQIQLADFSEFKTPGKYILVVDGVGKSEKFMIHEQPLLPLAKASLKAFYYNRCSYAIDRKHGGRWMRAAGHPDMDVQIHASAASEQRPEGYSFPSPGGWYDAGDYNKYIVNSGITMHTLLGAYEQFSSLYDTLKLDIPENTNTLPDLLDETLYNLRWMLTMQDPNDGGVYHKCTHHRFLGEVLPEEAIAQRIVVAKGTAATLDFAAVCAQASRVFRPFESVLPGLADSCLKMADYAWQWALDNPRVEYKNPSDVNTGEYGDGGDFSDEKFWAAVELFITSGDQKYILGIDFASVEMGVAGWPYVQPLGWLSLARNHEKVAETVPLALIKKKITQEASNLYYEEISSAYNISMGIQPYNFVWGSNSTAANQAIIQLTAYELTKDEKYLIGATNNMDYLLGRNPTGYCYVTGMGSFSPENPHHRPSQGDMDPDPVPGFLVGGPHSGQQDAGSCHCVYDSALPALSYVDAEGSYASNEIAINWNSPLAFVAGGLVYYTVTKP